MIHVVNMPFGSLTHPSIAPSLIKAQLNQAGMDCRVFNFNFDFARRIGFGGYETIAFFKGVETQIGEWLFAKEAWGQSFGLSEDEFIQRCSKELEHIHGIGDKGAWLKKIRAEVVPAFLDDCLASLRWAGELEVVGFSCSFFQTIAALALGRQIKEKYPEVKLIYGGACFHGEMGDELIRKVSWIDAVSVGEADDVMVACFEALKEGRPPAGLQGILYRDEKGGIQAGPSNRPVAAEVLDNLPFPDFNDFFGDADRVGLANTPQWLERIVIPFESSRGCWWGQKHHCTFCGLNGLGINYRRKSAEVVYQNILEYTRRYPATCYQAADNNLSLDYFHSLLPQLKSQPLTNGSKLYYGVKPNMNRSQIKLLADAGIYYVQPGIESVSSHLLELMNKGVSALQNVFFMKCCLEYGMVVYWNNLVRIPGETLSDYSQVKEWLLKISHLRPPYGGAPKIECHRFSPYFSEAGKWIERCRPQLWYLGLFPAERVDISRVAYYFDAEWKDTLGPESYEEVISVIWEWIRVWRDEPVLPQLTIYPGDNGGSRIRDTRGNHSEMWELNPAMAQVYEAIQDPIGITEIAEFLHGHFQRDLPMAEIQEILDNLTQNNLALEEDGFYLGLALPEITLPPLQVRQKQFQAGRK